MNAGGLLEFSLAKKKKGKNFLMTLWVFLQVLLVGKGEEKEGDLLWENSQT